MVNTFEHLTGFYFSLSLEGENIAFKEVSGINKETGIEEVASGGENRLPTTSSYKNLTLKRAIAPTGSKLISWCESRLNAGLAVEIQTKNVSISLLNNEGKVFKKWTFYNAYPTKYDVSDFKSQEHEILVETLELAYTYFDEE